MPPRLNKRQQREQEEIAALSTKIVNNESDVSSEEEPRRLPSLTHKPGAIDFSIVCFKSSWMNLERQKMNEVALQRRLDALDSMLSCLSF